MRHRELAWQTRQHLEDGRVPPALPNRDGSCARDLDQVGAPRPAHQAANRDDQRHKDPVGLGFFAHDRGHLPFDLQQQLLVILFGDCPTDTAITLELAVFVENRAPAQGHVMHLSGRIEQAEFESVERPLGVQIVAVPTPIGFRKVDWGQLPVVLAQAFFDPVATERGGRAVRQKAQALPKVSLPDPVCRQLRQIAKLRFARRQQAGHVSHRRDVLDDA